MVCRHLTQFLEENKFISDVQHDFRRTVTQLLTTCHDVSLAINDKRQLGAVFLYFTKAFDKVLHNKLLLELYAIRVNSRRTDLIGLIGLNLDNRVEYVQVDNNSSVTLPVT